MVKQELLEILCCPETKQNLFIADTSLIEKLNQKIDRKELKNRRGDIVESRIEGGLIRTDKKFLYSVRNDIPVMLIDEAIPL